MDNVKMGWLRDLPDFRDHHIKHHHVKKFQIKSQLFGDADGKAVPTKYLISDYVDLPPIKDQGQIGSCTANAAANMYGVFLRVLRASTQNANISYVDLSRLFIYKVTRNLMGVSGDTGGYLRTVMKSLAMFGAPPEENYQYDIRAYDNEPAAFHYAMAQNFQAIQYYRLDSDGMKDRSALLSSIQVNISANRPCIFGFTVYSNMDNTGDVAMPHLFDRVRGGHAICAVGYDNDYRIGDETGAIQFLNSWGPDWGHQGLGWLPYRYIIEGLATDWWTMFTAEWMNLECFK